MKKALKITGITLASLIGIVIIAIWIAVAVVTSPERLTRLVKQYVPQYIPCQMELGQASLSLSRTSPHVRVGIEQVALLNPMEGSPSDTLASIEEVKVAVDIMKLLKEKTISVRQCVLENAFINLYIDPEGKSNLDIFQATEKADTTSVPFDYLVDVEQVQLKNANVFLTDCPGVLNIEAKGIDMDLTGGFQDNDIQAEMKMKLADFYLLNYAATFGIQNVGLGFVGGLKQLERVEGVLTADKPDLQLGPAHCDPVNVVFPFVFSLKDLSGHYEKVQASLNNKYRLDMNGDVKVLDTGSFVFDFDVNSNKMDYEGLMSYLPEEVREVLNTNGKQDWLTLTIPHAEVAVHPAKVPLIQLGFRADDLTAKVSGQPYPLLDLSFDVLMSEDIRKKNPVERLGIDKLKATVKHSSLDIKGVLDDVSKDLRLKLNVNGDVFLPDVKALLPKTINLEGRTRLNLATNFTVGDLTKTLADYKLNRLSAKADLEIRDLAFDMDTIHAASPQFHASLVLPASSKVSLEVDSKAMDARLGESYALNTSSLKMNASVHQEMDKTGFLDQWNPNADFTLGNALVKISPLEEKIHVDSIDFLFNPEIIDVKNCTFRLGQSDLSVQGNVTGFKEQLENRTDVVKGDFHLNTDLLNVKEIVGLINGLNLPKEPKAEEAEIRPFMVPAGIDVTVGLNTKKTVYEDLDFNNLTGTVSMRDSTLNLQDIRFNNEAAQMELSALYRSMREDSLFFAMDFRLGDVLVGDLLDMIPYVDSLVPMLKTFDGQIDFNLDVATNLGANYFPMLPSLRGEADLKGRNLTVNDQFTFTKITDLLGVSMHGEYCVDTLNVQLSVEDSKVNLWPSQISIGKYGAIAEGFMTPDKNLEYHIFLTEAPFPLHHGLKISGSLDKLRFDLERNKYPHHYTPLTRSERRQFHKDLRKMLAERLRNKLQKAREE